MCYNPFESRRLSSITEQTDAEMRRTAGVRSGAGGSWSNASKRSKRLSKGGNSNFAKRSANSSGCTAGLAVAGTSRLRLAM